MSTTTVLAAAATATATQLPGSIPHASFAAFEGPLMIGVYLSALLTGALILQFLDYHSWSVTLTPLIKTAMATIFGITLVKQLLEFSSLYIQCITNAGRIGYDWLNVPLRCSLALTVLVVGLSQTWQIARCHTISRSWVHTAVSAGFVAVGTISRAFYVVIRATQPFAREAPVYRVSIRVMLAAEAAASLWCAASYIWIFLSTPHRPRSLRSLVINLTAEANVVPTLLDLISLLLIVAMPHGNRSWGTAQQLIPGAHTCALLYTLNARQRRAMREAARKELAQFVKNEVEKGHDRTNGGVAVDLEVCYLAERSTPAVGPEQGTMGLFGRNGVDPRYYGGSFDREFLRKYEKEKTMEPVVPGGRPLFSVPSVESLMSHGTKEG